MRAGKPRHDSLDLRTGEHHRDLLGATCPFDVLDVGQLRAKYLPVENEQRLEEGHVPGRGGHVILRSQVGQVSADLTYPQLSRMELAIEADEVHNIVQIRGFGPTAHVCQAYSPTDLVVKRRRPCRGPAATGSVT